MITKIQAHPELWKGLDNPSDADRAWFIKNPKKKVRIRELLPEELDAHDAMAKAADGSQWQRLQLYIGGKPQPITHVCVVDLLRFKGAKHGPDGESARIRIPCSAPIDKWTQKAIESEVLGLVAAMFPRASGKRKSGGRGFL